jgi:hypothetical protein
VTVDAAAGDLDPHVDAVFEGAAEAAGRSATVTRLSATSGIQRCGAAADKISGGASADVGLDGARIIGQATKGRTSVMRAWSGRCRADIADCPGAVRRLGLFLRF